MPIYEYKCNNCNIVKEVMHKISESPEVLCPECKKNMSRLISASAFHLKGSGWYVTDYKKNNNKEKKTVSTKKETKNSCTENSCKSCCAKAVNE